MMESLSAALDRGKINGDCAPRPRSADHSVCDIERRQPNHDKGLAFELISIELSQKIPIELGVEIAGGPEKAAAYQNGAAGPNTS